MKAGSTPASTGRSRSSRAANAWMVEMGASSRPFSAAASRLAIARRRLVACEEAFEPAADALAQLPGGLLGEGDGHDLADRGPIVAGQAGDVAVDQHSRLAGAGARLDQERGVQIARHAPPHVVVDREARFGGFVLPGEPRLFGEQRLFDGSRAPGGVPRLDRLPRLAHDAPPEAPSRAP